MMRETYHLEEKKGGKSRVDWHCHKVRELPGAIDEDVDVFGEHVDNLSFFLVFDLPLTQATRQLEQPTLDLCLAESKVVVDMHVVVATTENGQDPQHYESNEKSDSVCLSVELSR